MKTSQAETKLSYTLQQKISYVDQEAILLLCCVVLCCVVLCCVVLCCVVLCCVVLCCVVLCCCVLVLISAMQQANKQTRFEDIYTGAETRHVYPIPRLSHDQL